MKMKYVQIIFLSLLLSISLARAKHPSFVETGVDAWREEFDNGRDFNHWSTPAANNNEKNKIQEQHVDLVGISKDKTLFAVRRYTTHAKKTKAPCSYPKIKDESPLMLSLALCEVKTGACLEEWLIYDYNVFGYSQKKKWCTSKKDAKQRLALAKQEMTKRGISFDDESVINIIPPKHRPDSYCFPKSVLKSYNITDDISVFVRDKITKAKPWTVDYPHKPSDIDFDIAVECGFCRHDPNYLSIKTCTSFYEMEIWGSGLGTFEEEYPQYRVNHMAMDKEGQYLFVWLEEFYHYTKRWGVYPKPIIVKLEEVIDKLKK